MRRLVLLTCLPLALAACGGDTPVPTANAPATPAPGVADAPASTATPNAAATAPLFGNWAADPANCSSPVVISATSFQGADNSCEISGYTDNADGTFTAAMSCSSQGQTAAERIQMEPIFGPAGEGVRLTYLDRGGDPVVLFNCPVPKAD